VVPATPSDGTWRTQRQGSALILRVAIREVKYHLHYAITSVFACSHRRRARLRNDPAPLINGGAIKAATLAASSGRRREVPARPRRTTVAENGSKVRRSHRQYRGYLGQGEGMARIINPGDNAGAHRVFNITRIRVLTPPPA
jgi:hypothetical protein